MNCPGSVALCAQVEKVWSEHAALGSAAHVLCETCLNRGQQAAIHMGARIVAQGKEFLVDEDMVKAVQLYLNTVRGYLTLGGDLSVEVKGTLSPFIDDIWGTADAVVYLPYAQRLVVVDYKHGAGMFVEVENNPQLMIYAAMALMHCDGYVSEVDIVVVQPRCGQGRPVRTWTISREDLAAWLKGSLLQAANVARQPDAPLVPDPDVPGYCRFCDAKNICPAKQEQTVALAQRVFSNNPPAALQHNCLMRPTDMNPQQIAAALDFKPLIDEWFAKVAEIAKDKATRGEAIPGKKLVRGKRSRQWRDEGEAAARLTRNQVTAYTKKLVTPAQARTAMKEAGFDNDRIQRVMEGIESWTSPGLCLVNESDKRKAVSPPKDAAEVFTPVNPFK